jgi:hypothetical protein
MTIKNNLKKVKIISKASNKQAKTGQKQVKKYA